MEVLEWRDAASRVRQAGLQVPASPWHLLGGEVQLLLCFSALQAAQSGCLAPLEQRQ